MSNIFEPKDYVLPTIFIWFLTNFPRKDEPTIWVLHFHLMTYNLKSIIEAASYR